MFQSFTTWAELLDAIAADHRVYYQAPLDYQPVLISCKVRRDGRIRCNPIYSNADPFNADQAHLTRFRRQVPNV